MRESLVEKGDHIRFQDVNLSYKSANAPGQFVFTPPDEVYRRICLMFIEMHMIN